MVDFVCLQKPHLGEGLDLSAVASGSLPWEEAERAMAGCFILDKQLFSTENSIESGE